MALTKLIIQAIAIVALAGCTTAAPSDEDDATTSSGGTTTTTETPGFMRPPTEPAAPFALVELFTSEG